jgi:hypothetical protein
MIYQLVISHLETKEEIFAEQYSFYYEALNAGREYLNSNSLEGIDHNIAVYELPQTENEFYNFL